MLARHNRTRYWFLLLLGIVGLLVVVFSSTPVHAAELDSGPVVTIQFHTHLRFRPFWLSYNAPKSRYYATLDACVDPLFTIIRSKAYDFGNCFVMQDAKPGYTPISVPQDNDYIRLYDITYWTRSVQVIMPDQFAHTLDLTTEYVFHDRGQKAPGGGPLVLSHSVLVTSEITLSASDGAVEVQMNSSIPHIQYVHFVFRAVGTYDHTLTFWGCLRRPTEGVPSAYCTQLSEVSSGAFQIDAKLPAVSQPASLFGPDVDPLLEGTNIEMSIVAAPAGPILPDAQPAPPGFTGHPANQIVTPAESTFDCAMATALVYADVTLECTSAIKHDTLGQPYLAPTLVKAYIGSPPSVQQNPCVVCTGTSPVPYAGPLLLVLFLLLLGAGGIVTLMCMGRVPVSATSGRPLLQQPMFVSSSLLAVVSLVFLVSLAIQFRTGSQPAIPGKIILQITPGASPVKNDVPPTPTPTPSPTPPPSPTPKASPSPGPTPTPELERGSLRSPEMDCGG
jgi:hypothetical protein